MKMRKILIFAHSSGLGGAERSLLETIDLLKKEFIIYVIVPAKGKFYEKVLNAGIEDVFIVKSHFFYEKLGYSSLKKTIKQGVNFFSIMKSFYIAKRIGADVIYTNSIASWVGPIVSLMLKVPNIWHLRELSVGTSIGNPVFGRVLEKKILESAGFQYLVNSFYVQNWYSSRFGLVSTVAYQPVHIEVTKVGGVDFTKTKKISIFGRLQNQKRQHVVIDSLKFLPDTIVDKVEFHFYGAGSLAYFNFLKDRIDNRFLRNVFFHGHIDSIVDGFMDTNLVIAPSVGEAFGRVTVEAMIFGIPVIGASSGGTLELIGSKSERGSIFSEDNPMELSRKILDYIENTEKYDDKTKVAQNWLADNISKESYCQIFREKFL